MFSYASGWMTQWRPEGEIRMRFSPEPVCEQWRPTVKHWAPTEPGFLWLEEAERFRKRLGGKRKTAKQLPLPGVDTPVSGWSPPRPQADLAAYHVWQQVPGHWKKLLQPVVVHPWRVMRFLSEFGKVGEDLLRSNPGLAWLLASQYLRGTPLEVEAGAQTLGRTLARRQRDLLELVGLSPKPWMVKMVRKLEMDDVPAHCLQRLRCLERHDVLREILQHTERLPYSVCRMISPETAGVVTRELIEEMSQMPLADPRVDFHIENLKDVGVLKLRGELVPRFKTPLELEQWRWKRDAGLGLHKKVEKRHPDEYPAPPFAGTETILPITNRRLLQEEGKRMRHCIRSYHKEIWHGRVAVYAVFDPERATLGLRKNPDGSWRVFDFRCRCNRHPRLETRREVGRWLSQFDIRLQ